MQKLKLEELNRISPEEYRAAEKMPVCILLDNVRSLHNVGAAFRTGDAFRVEKIYLAGITGQPPHREIQKTALGATEVVPWEYFENANDIAGQLKKDGYSLVMVEQTTESMPLQKLDLDVKKKYCLVFGNEVTGIDEALLTQGTMALEVPQAGTKHSLNISVCLGIVLWEFYKRLHL